MFSFSFSCSKGAHPVQLAEGSNKAPGEEETERAVFQRLPRPLPQAAAPTVSGTPTSTICSTPTTTATVIPRLRVFIVSTERN